MKLITSFIFCALLLVYVSCKKDVSISGDWQWQYSSLGGIAGGIVKPADDTVVSLSLNQNLIYIIYVNNQVNVSGAYSVTTADNVNTIHFDKPINAYKLFLDNEEIMRQSNDSLFFINNSIEASPTSLFTRIMH